jgi:hypothetical protein
MGEPWLIYRHTTVAPFCSLPSWTYVFPFSNKKMYLTLYVYSRCRVVDNTVIFWSHFFSENAETCGGSSRYFEHSPLLISKCRHKKKNSAFWWTVQWNTIGLSERTFVSVLRDSSYYTPVVQKYIFLPPSVDTFSVSPGPVQRSKRPLL